MKIRISPDQNTVIANKIDYQFVKTSGNEFVCNKCSFNGKTVYKSVPCDYRANIGISRIDNTAGYFIKNGSRP